MTADVEVAAGVLVREGRVLITRRKRGEHLGGFWEFPGGKREADETFEECLRRELKEELDVEVAVGEVIESVRHQYPDRSVYLRFFRCALAGGEPKTLGCEAMAWVAPEELAGYRLPPADERLLTVLRDRPDLWSQSSGQPLP